ncbi:MAG: glycoside hydrolase [Chloroflexi bacterium]|jgi:alpha-glucosidase (family GH31 glycosyl hydrolase)|nr:glycoside hydrolase [Chloroflexota bacterium]
MIQLETTQSPFSISFKQNNISLMIVRIDSADEPNLHSDDSSLTAIFPRFSLNLNLVADTWVLTSSPSDSPVTVKIELPGYWYGGGELINQQHPLNKIMLHSAPFHTFDNGPTGLSGVMTPAWFSSNGALIIADSPVEVGINQPPADYPRFQWTFATDGRGAFADRPFLERNKTGDGLFTFTGESLNLQFSFSENAVTAYQNLVTHFGRPTELPPEELFSKPTWTTWARYKTAINQEVVLKFADEIIAHQYPRGVMEIDDRWQVYYGDLEFDPQRFPNPKAMIDELHVKGFKVTTWVIPFLDEESQAFADGTKNNWLVRRADGSPYLVPWWQGRGGLLDVTNPSALEWFFGRLTQLQVRTGCDGFKFDAGEACFLPNDAVTHQKIRPNEYSKIYVDAVAKHHRLTEVRSGWKNQSAPIFFRQWDKTTSWGLDNGLHSLLTGALAMSLAGYPFILPDMVGGNEYDEKADAEMMIRWTQLNALLPAMQFSLAPWDYGADAAELCRRYANLHVEFAPKILEIAKSAIQNGQPIIRPIFWLDPSDERALTCDDEFLLGDEFLVAPVVTPNTTQRDVYLPKGKWQDVWTGEIATGNTLLENHPTPLDLLPIFKRIQ